MRVDRLTLRDFTVFQEADFDFSSGLNVLIGANGTGKSHLLKLLYSATRSIAISSEIVKAAPGSEICKVLGRPILEALERTFRLEPGQSPLSGLSRHGVGQSHVEVHGDFGNVVVEFHGIQAETNFSSFANRGGLAVFLPAIEVLSIYPGFVSAFERRELSVDGTVRDLCVDLSASPLRTVEPPVLADLVAELDNAVGGKTVLRGDRFYVLLSDDWPLEAAMLAEGLRKLAVVTQLIRNGSLAENCVLFWDEPETNLNPKLIPVVAEALMKLAGTGIQVFIATHDYLLTNELSVAAEYGTPEGKAARSRFFCLGRSSSREPVTIQTGDTVADLGTNPILEEFAAHYDRNQRLFAQAQPTGVEE